MVVGSVSVGRVVVDSWGCWRGFAGVGLASSVVDGA